VLHKFKRFELLLVAISRFNSGYLVFNLEIMSEKDVKRLNGIVLNVEKDKWLSCVRVKCKVIIIRCDGGEGSMGGV
jgi:hypothetical protein